MKRSWVEIVLTGLKSPREEKGKIFKNYPLKIWLMFWIFPHHLHEVYWFWFIWLSMEDVWQLPHQSSRFFGPQIILKKHVFQFFWPKCVSLESCSALRSWLSVALAVENQTVKVFRSRVFLFAFFMVRVAILMQSQRENGFGREVVVLATLLSHQANGYCQESTSILEPYTSRCFESISCEWRVKKFISYSK